MKPTTYTINGPWNGQLAIVARPRGNDWLEDEIRDLAQEGFQVIVSLLTASESDELGLTLECDLARKQHLNFISFAVEDYSVPQSADATYDLVIKLNEMLTDGKTVGIHCRAGIGRSSLLAACLLSLNQNVDDSFAQIAEARGRHVPDTPQQRSWVKQFAESYSLQSAAN